MATRTIGIVMHGVTGRMGMNQHLIRSVLAIRDQGGVALRDGSRLVPDPIIVGRNADKIESLAKAHGVARWTTDLDAALAVEVAFACSFLDERRIRVVRNRTLVAIVFQHHGTFILSGLRR